MASIREQIADAILALVNTSRPFDVPEITRTYLHAMELDAAKHVSLYQTVTQPMTGPGGGVWRYATFLRFRLGAKATATTRPDEEVRALDTVSVSIVTMIRFAWSGPPSACSMMSVSRSTSPRVAVPAMTTFSPRRRRIFVTSAFRKYGMAGGGGAPAASRFGQRSASGAI